MSLKQHNDIVQKLLKQINTKDQQIESLKKELHKSGAITPQSKSSQTQKQLNKKITQLHKQYKQKINSLTQTIRAKSTQNKDLKQRLTTKKNIQAKQKQQVAEILKKSATIAAHDPKFAAMISHYETQIQRKDKHIATLQKQIKDNYYKRKSQQFQRKQYNQENQQENDQPIHQNIKQNGKIPNLMNQQHYHTKYQQQINSLKTESNKYQRLFQQKSKEFKDLTKRYSDLTKQYYKILNQYGAKQKTIVSQQLQSTKPMLKNKQKSKATGIGNILQQMLDKFDNQEKSQQNDQSLSYSFLSNYNKMKNNENTNKQFNMDQRQYQALSDLVQNIMEMLGVQNRMHIIPALTKIKIKCQQFCVYENISKFIHSMLYRCGMGKIPMSEIITQLQKFEVKINKYIQNSDKLDEICIQMGAKKQKLLQKIQDYKATQQQLFSNMKDINYMQQLPKANKVVQFIQYFELDKQICELPQQLKKMYEQLKYVDRFLKQVSIILQKEPQGLQRSLQFIIRYLQRKQAEQSLKSQQVNGNGKKIGNKKMTNV